MDTEVDVELKKECEVCGGYMFKTKIKKYIKEELKTNPDKYAFSDLRIPTKDGKLHHFCGDCFYKAIMKASGKPTTKPKKKNS